MIIMFEEIFVFSIWYDYLQISGEELWNKINKCSLNSINTVKILSKISKKATEIKLLHLEMSLHFI